MRVKGIVYIVFISCLMTVDCVRVVKVPVRNVPPMLVVQGLVTTSPGPYTINLSYSGRYTNGYQAAVLDSQYFIPDAKVVIRDDVGDSTTCSYAGFGNYLSDSVNFKGVVGRSYTLAVYLSNGRVYLSKPETLPAVAPIDSLTIGYDSAGLTFIQPPPLVATVNSHDPGGGPHYYRWSSFGYIPRKSWGFPCNISDPPCNDPFVCTCEAFCEQVNSVVSQVTLYSNQYTEGRQIIKPVYYSPVYWFGKHFMEIDQYSLTLTSYRFWEQYLEQTNRTGSILDPLPSPVTGNIYNAADSNDLALGIFSASGVFQKKLTVVPFFLQEYELESVAGSYILPGDCDLVYRNTLPDLVSPPAWDSAEVLNLH